MKVSDVVASKGSTDVFTVSPETTVRDLLDLLADKNVGALVVSADDTHVDGIVSERDVVRKLLGVEHPLDQPVSSIMSSDVHTCTPQDEVELLLEVMTNARVRHVPVVDEEGALVAILSIGDAVKFRMRQLQFERDQLDEYVASAR